MILLLRPDPPFVEFCKAENDNFSTGRVMSAPGEIRKIVDNPDEIEGIGHLLYHGGEIFKDTVSILDKNTLNKIEQCIGFSPENNGLTLRTVQIFLEKYPLVPQILFCDTAYFSDLPREASTYAIFHISREKGIRRYGGYGLVHREVWEKIRSISRKTHSIVSIYLGDNPNIAAIREGKPVEITIGFTSVEGLPSFGGCGDVDPTIVFQLHSKGMSFGEISGVLSKESGFKGLAGKECHYLDIVANNKTAGISKLKRVLCYNIVKYVGAFVSVLGGVDKIVFSTRHLEQSRGFIKEICKSLNFLGLSEENIFYIQKDQDISEEDLDKRVFCIEQCQWCVMAQEIKNKIKGGELK